MHAFGFVDYSFRALLLARRPQLVGFCPIALIWWHPGRARAGLPSHVLSPRGIAPFRVSVSGCKQRAKRWVGPAND